MTEENIAPSNLICNIKRDTDYRANPINRYHDTYQASVNRSFATFVAFLTLFFSVTQLGLHQTVTIVAAFILGLTIGVVFIVLFLYLIHWLKGY
jgi:hypothetical protein